MSPAAFFAAIVICALIALSWFAIQRHQTSNQNTETHNSNPASSPASLASSAPVAPLPDATRKPTVAYDSQLASRYLNQNKAQNVIDLATPAAQDGNVTAEHDLGIAYHQMASNLKIHSGSQSDVLTHNSYVAQSMHWLQKATDDGDPEAAYDLATSYYGGVGSSGPGLTNVADLGKAYSAFLVAANLGNRRSKYVLGEECIPSVQHCPVDTQKACSYLKQAANEGEADAKNLLSRLRAGRKTDGLCV
ncbi:MAG: Sel1 domain protein repeat-containing protein [Edaphobacter sp.]|nr:Sel1 domain protein repeat-containing protein [Edaphobacter sp.]